MPTMSRYNSTAALPVADDSSVSSVSRASSSSSLSSMASTVASPFASLIPKSPETKASATAALAGGTMRRTNSATSLADAAVRIPVLDGHGVPLGVPRRLFADEEGSVLQDTTSIW